MERNLKDTLKYYCEKEIEMFVSSSIYSELSKLVESHKFNLELNFGNAKEEKDKNLYLSLSVFDKNGNVNWTFSCSDGNVFIENRESVIWKNSNAKTT